MLYLLALLIGIVAGLRAMTAPAAVSWAAYLGWINVGATWVSFMGYWLTPWIFSVLAVFELINDKLPNTPSRKVPMQFGTRLVTGALSGATIGVNTVGWVAGLFVGVIAGVIGAVLGTLGGAAARQHLVANAGGRDLPIALLEDVVAIFGALLVVNAVTW